MMTHHQEGTFQMVKVKTGYLLRPSVGTHTISFLLMSLSQAAQNQGKENKLHLLMGEWEDHIVKELAEGEILF